MRFNKTENSQYSARGLHLCRETAFTFFEIMIALVILSVGMTGIYRAFLTALNYQQYILTRLHVINILSDEFARAENVLIQKADLLSVAAEIAIPGSQASRFFIQRTMIPLPEDQKGLRALQVKLLWSQEDRSQEFVRGSLVYAKE